MEMEGRAMHVGRGGVGGLVLLVGEQMRPGFEERRAREGPGREHCGGCGDEMRECARDGGWGSGRAVGRRGGGGE